MPKTFPLYPGQLIKHSSLAIPEKKREGCINWNKLFYSALLQALLCNYFSFMPVWFSLFFPVISLPCLRTQCSPKSSARQALPVLQVKPGSLLQMLSKCCGKKVYVLLLPSFLLLFVFWLLCLWFAVVVFDNYTIMATSPFLCLLLLTLPTVSSLP